MAYKQKRNPFKRMSTMLAEGAGAAEEPGRDFRAPLNKGIAKEKTFEETEGKAQPMSIDIEKTSEAGAAGAMMGGTAKTPPPEPPDPDREDGGYDDDGGPPDVPHPSEKKVRKNPDEDPPPRLSREDAQEEEERFNRQRIRFEERNPGYTIDEKGFIIEKRQKSKLATKKTPLTKLGSDEKAWQDLHDGNL